MKLIIAIVSNDDANKVQSELTKNGFSITKLATTGGFLMSGNTTLICGTQDEKVDKAIPLSVNSARSAPRWYPRPLPTALVCTPRSRWK